MKFNFCKIYFLFIFYIAFGLNVSMAGHIVMAEDCQNGLDDDGDGLIDLNDIDDCICTGLDTIPFTSLIPNSSFENFNQCPYDYAQLTFLQDWIQASEATSDYYNTCNFSGDGDLGLYGDPPQPLPNGNGYVGFSNASSGVYKEYIGACLNGPLKKDSSYTLQFNLGFGDNGRLRPFSPFEINIFGTSACLNLPFDGETCPLGQDDWTILGTTNVSGDGSWELVTYDFIPTMDIYALVIGPGCTSHHESYYWLDNIQLNQTISFEGCPAYYSIKNNCGTIELQSDHVDLTCEVQWYFNGVAIAGATDRNYLIPQAAEGEYQMMLTSQGICNLGDTYMYVDSRIQFVGNIDTSFCEGAFIMVGPEMFNEEGTFQTSWRSEEGCDTLFNIEIELLPSNSRTIDTLLCLGQTITIDNMLYDQSGMYEIEESNVNGCVSVTELIIQFQGQIEQSQIETICTGQSFMIGDMVFDQSGLYDIVTPGVGGCDTLTRLDLKVIDGFPNMTITRTDMPNGELFLELASVDLSLIKTIEWTGAGLIECLNCTSTSVTPLNGLNEYSVTVIDQNDCVSTETLMIDFEIIPGVFIPNAFTPNGDGTNDRLVVFTDETIREIQEFTILNRWGDIIYNAYNVAPNDLNSGWDGYYKGEEQLSGVYLYAMRLVDIRGQVLFVKGDFTLIK